MYCAIHSERYSGHEECPGCLREQQAEGRAAAARAAKQEQDPHGIDAHAPGAKLDDNKVMAGLMMKDFAKALLAMAEVTTFGAKKYSKSGWRSVKDGEARYADARSRHELKRMAGETLDADSGLLHLAHEAWNCLAELELYLARRKETLTSVEMCITGDAGALATHLESYREELAKTIRAAMFPQGTSEVE